MENFSDYIISKNAIINNAKNIKKSLGKNVLLCAMVKANAYGHGLKNVCKFLNGTADFFGVANVTEAKMIRDENIKTPIVVVGIPAIKHINWCAENNVSVTIASLKQFNSILKVLGNKKLKVHIKINTGLNRIGFKSLKSVEKLVTQINACSNVKLEGVFTHFATKAADVDFLNLQAETFNKYCNAIKSLSKEKCIIIHCCNSYATLNVPNCHFNMVRCGFALYGYQQEYFVKLTESLRITSQIVFVEKIKAGDTVGYDRTFKADKPMKIAVVPLGYADGMDRRLSNNFEVLVNGHWAKIVGNICMDVFMIDVSEVPNVKVGSKLTILGRDGTQSLTIAHYAHALGTSEYEILLKFNYSRMNYVIE